jgi:hypothetical protein
LLAALAGLVLAALTALATLMLLARPVLRALSALAAALLRTLILLLIALRVVLLVRHWEILRLLVWECTPPPQPYQRPAKTEVPKAAACRHSQRIVTAEQKVCNAKDLAHGTALAACVVGGKSAC